MNEINRAGTLKPKRDRRTKPRKEGDKRSQHVTYSVEAEAMPARDLRAILRDNVESLLPENALEVSKVAEQSELQHLERMAEMFDAGQV